jgi:hypothetical protein
MGQGGGERLSSRLQPHSTGCWTKNRKGLLDLNLRELDVAGIGSLLAFQFVGGNGEGDSGDCEDGLDILWSTRCSASRFDFFKRW